MKVALFVRCLGKGGAERTVSNLSINMDGLADQTVIVQHDFKEYEHKGNLVNLDVGYTNDTGLLKLFFASLMLKKRLKQNKKAEKYDAVVSFMESSNLPNIATRIKGQVCMISVRNFRSKTDKFDGLRGTVLKVLTKLNYNKADLCIACSEDVRSDLIENYGMKPNKVKVIYNPLDVEKIQNSKKELSEISSDNFNILNVGRLGSQKGQWHLIHSMVDVIKKVPNAKLHILGRGPYEDELKRLITHLGLEEYVVMHGFRDDVYAFMNACDTLVLSSLFEGIPNAVTEAFGADLPIVAVNCLTGPRELLHPTLKFGEKVTDVIEADYGILTPSFSESLEFYNISSEDRFAQMKLAEGIIKMSNADLRNKYKAIYPKKAQELHKDVITRKWLEVIKEEVDKKQKK